MRLFLREANECKLGTQWWVCNSPQFRGCCSVDACHHGGCPDIVEPSTTITVSMQQQTDAPSSPLSVVTASFTSISPSSTTSSSPSFSTGISAAKTGQVTSIPSAAVNTAGPTLPVQLRPTDTNVAGSSLSTTPIIAGSVAGAVALAVLAVLIWCCVRRRRTERLSTGTSTTNFVEPKNPSHTDSISQSRTPSSDDIFAPFGGYHRSHSMQERRLSNASTSSQQTVIVHHSAQPIPQDEEDEPIPDFEKSSISAPPLIDHPALHPLPGQSPEVPAYHPGQEIVSPELAQHPTYLAKHPSLVNKHPALRMNEPSSANLRSNPESHLTFPFKKVTSSSKEVTERDEQNDSLSNLPFEKHKKHNRLSRIFQRRSYTPITDERKEFVQKPRKTKSFEQIETSPIPGRSELPAVVPQELGSTPVKIHANSVDIFKLAVEKRIHSPIGLGVKAGTSNSPSRNFQVTHSTPVVSQDAHSQSVIQVSAGSPSRKRSRRPSKRPTRFTQSRAAPNSNEPIQAEYHVSPRSAESPALQSAFYQSHIVSPDISAPTEKGQEPRQGNSPGQFVAFGHSFDRKPHVSQMQMPSRSPPRSYTPPTSKPLPLSPSPNLKPTSLFSSSRSRVPSSPQRPRIDTSAPGLLRKHKDSLGKGTENVMSWATYNASVNTDTSTNASSRGSVSGMEISELAALQPLPLAPANLRGTRRPSAITQPESQSTNSKPSRHEERWSGSTAASESVHASPAETSALVEAVNNEISPSVYSQDEYGSPYSFVAGSDNAAITVRAPAAAEGHSGKAGTGEVLSSPSNRK